MKVEIGNATLYCGDWKDVLPLVSEIDVTITDPPYSEGTHKGARGKGASTGGKHKLLTFDCLPPAELIESLGLLCSISRRWVVSFSDMTQMAHVALSNALPLVRVGVWTKNDPAPQFTGDRPATGWESVLILHREGAKRWNGGGKPAVWRTNIVKTDGEHPTQKPLPLMESIVALFTDASELVFDPFMGSGTTGVACMGLGRRFVGVEKDPAYFDVACKRVEATQAQGRLFA